MTPERDGAPVLRLTDGIWLDIGPQTWRVEPLRLFPGQWAALVPRGAEPAMDPAGVLARVLASLSPPKRGTVEILGRDVYRIPYRDVQRLRGRLGFVQGYGGLLSNRSIRENIALPLSVHGHLSYREEGYRVDQILEAFSLGQVSGLHPHEMDGATRWRACLARSMVLSPDWVVLEGIGDWEMDRGRGVAWGRFREYRERGKAAGVICLSRNNPEFEAWFEKEGGAVIGFGPAAGGAA